MSSAGFVGKRTNTFDDVVGTSQNEERLSQWGEIDGEIVSFNSTDQTATVRPLYKPKFNGVALDMPNLEAVPVRFQRTGNGALTFPVPNGTKVKLRPKMRSSENYLLDGDGEASDARSFGLSDMEAHLDGGESLQDPLQNFDTANTHLRTDPAGQYGIKGNDQGKFDIVGAEGSYYDMLANAMELDASGFTKLGTEPGLVHASEYAAIGAQLTALTLKIRAMQL